MGAVFKARQEAFGRLVALKILPQSLARNPAFLERFLREARAAARLSDPNIVQAIDAGEANGYYYFAMELVDGQSLAALLARQTRLPERRALEITRDLARALQHAHREGIIHRDVKPANILLGNDGTTKLADLGLAREAQQAKSDVTHAGDTMGTPDYISPEQIRGEKDLDGRADIYSLGATLYHMLVGTSPFLGGNSAQVMTRHLTEPIPDPRSAVPELSPACSQIVRKAMQKERERRYATAGDMLKDVEAALAGEGVSGGGLRPFVPTRGQTTTRLMGMASPAGRTVGRPTQAMRKAARSRKSPTATIVATVATVTAVLVLVFIAIFGFPSDEASPSNGSSGFPTDTVKPEIAQLISEQDFAGALKRVAELRLAHPDEIEFLRGLERDVLYEVHAFYQSALQKAQFEATKGNYEEAIAVLRPVLGFGIPDLKLAAEAKIVEMEQKQTEKRVKEQWQSIREQVADALASGQFAEARAILDEAKGLALAGMADLVEREKDRVDAAEAEEHQRRLANYDRESDRFWGLKERQYTEAQRLINTLHKNAAYRDIAAKVQADVRAAELRCTSSGARSKAASRSAGGSLSPLVGSAASSRRSKSSVPSGRLPPGKRWPMPGLIHEPPSVRPSACSSLPNKRIRPKPSECWPMMKTARTSGSISNACGNSSQSNSRRGVSRCPPSQPSSRPCEAISGPQAFYKRRFLCTIRSRLEHSSLVLR